MKNTVILNSYNLHIFSYYPPLFNFGPCVVEMTDLEPRFLLQQFACVCSVYNLERHTLGNGLFGISSRCVCSHTGATTTHTQTLSKGLFYPSSVLPDRSSGRPAPAWQQAVVCRTQEHFTWQ